MKKQRTDKTKNAGSLHIAMIGHKRVPSREGGVEIVVWELATRLRDMGYEKKYCHVEPFHYSVFRINPWEIHTGYDEISYMEEPYLLLFDYEKRSPFSREAECSILATVHG